MRVAHFVELFPKLSETFILHQVTGMVNIGHDVHIIADRAAAEPKYHSKIDEYGLKDRTIYTNPPQSYADAITQAAQAVLGAPSITKEVVRSFQRGKSGGRRIANLRVATNMEMSKFDVFHAHFGDVGKSWDFLKSNPHFPTNTRFVVSFYGIDASKRISDDPGAYDTLFEIADVVTVLSEDMRSTLINVGCPESKTVIQPLPIDGSRFKFIPREKNPNEPFKIITVARFDEQKGLRYAIDAIAELDDNYDIDYSIAGDGPLFDDIEEKVLNQGIEDSVELLGWLNADEIIELMTDAHIFMLPSVTTRDGAKEGTPTVLLEAQAVGLPVVSTYHAGIPEIVCDEKSGLLVPQRDVDSLVDALRRVIENPGQWKKMGEEGRKRVENNHRISTVIDRLESVYAVE
jgi:colanic acid/amylovoran biosynthesis glycosyltransferase